MLTTRKAVLPTSCHPSLLPATKTVPVELLPLAGVATIERIIGAASGVGLTDVLLITNGGNRSIEDHFDRDPVLERCLFDHDDRVALAAIRRAASLATVHSVRQGRAFGAGDGLALAQGHVGTDAFVVLDPNRLVAQEADLLGALDAAHVGDGHSVVAVPSGAGNAGRSAPPDPRDLTVDDFEHYGRYLFTADVFEALDDLAPDQLGERRIGAACALLARQGRLRVITSMGDRCDLTDRLDRLRTELLLLLADPDLAAGVEHVLADALDRHAVTVAA